MLNLINRIIENVKTLFGVAANNADEIKILSSKLSKLNDLIKLFTIASKVFNSPNGSSSLTVCFKIDYK